MQWEKNGSSADTPALLPAMSKSVWRSINGVMMTVTDCTRFLFRIRHHLGIIPCESDKTHSKTFRTSAMVVLV